MLFVGPVANQNLEVITLTSATPLRATLGAATPRDDECIAYATHEIPQSRCALITAPHEEHLPARPPHKGQNPLTLAVDNRLDDPPGNLCECSLLVRTLSTHEFVQQSASVASPARGRREGTTPHAGSPSANILYLPLLDGPLKHW